jgi:ABC-type phosphate transport system substrate-binding protein
MRSDKPPTMQAPASSLLRPRLVVCAALVLVLGIGLVARASAESPSSEFIVVVNRQNAATSLSREFLADAFLKKASHWDGGETIRTVDQRADSSARNAFSSSVLKRTVRAVRNYWQQRIFSGGDLPPPELDSDDAVVGYVARYRGGVGYVSRSANLGDTKAVSVQ